MNFTSKSILFGAFIGLATLQGCVKKTSSSTYDEGTMTATINGTTVSSKNVHACSCGSPNSYEVNVSGSTINMKIMIKDAGFVAGATSSIDDAFTKARAEYAISSTAATKNAKNGTVTISSLNPGVDVKGTFSFTLTDGTTVTGGSFTAVFP